MIVLKNSNATDIEKELFFYSGFYKIEDDSIHSKYVPVHVKTHDNFPNEIEIESQFVEYDTSITFFHTSETVDCVGSFDGKLINLITARMKELGWQL